jgi:biopolymer transport protein ExbD
MDHSTLSYAFDPQGHLRVALRHAQDSKPPTIRLSVDAQGSYYWNDTKLADSELEPMLQAEAAKSPQPVLHIRGDKAVRYEKVAHAMAAAQRAGLHRMGFITEPGAN